jgi:BirA family biotin operon repressor/biotin-[acetyl-CoA-carboxylase] ligase
MSPPVPPQNPDQKLADRLQRETRFERLLHVAECGSTQDLAAAADAAGWSVCWSDHQTQGRGRQQRVWDDERALDLAVTFRVQVRLPNPVALPAVMPLCVLRAASAMTKTVHCPIDARIRLKWPNDVLVDGRKLAGVLIDASGVGRDSYLIGIGINVNRTRMPRELEATATSLALCTGTEFDRGELLRLLANDIDRTLARLEANGSDDMRILSAEYNQRLALIGRDVVIDTGTQRIARLVAMDFERATLDDGSRVALGQIRSLRAV